MAIDYVHDLQAVYRKMLHSMSRPGTISSIHETAERTHNVLLCYEATFLSAMTLLDREVTFSILSDESDELVEKFSEYTLAKYAPVNEADYIFVLEGTPEEVILEAMKSSKNGDLVDPQNSSTWIIESSFLSNRAGVTLTGPGIKHTEILDGSFTPAMWERRNERTKEYPMGIDLIFVDEYSQIACVPRTTIVELEEV